MQHSWYLSQISLIPMLLLVRILAILVYIILVYIILVYMFYMHYYAVDDIEKQSLINVLS